MEHLNKTLFFLILICFLLNISCKKKEIDHYKSKTSIHIIRIFDAIYVYELKNKELPLLSDSKNDYKVNVNELLLILKSKDKDGISYLDEHVKKIDISGRPYIVWFDGDGDGKIKLDNGTIINNNIAIWSKGINGINEYGAGDDISSWSLEK